MSSCLGPLSKLINGPSRKMESLSMKSKPDEYTDPFERTAVSAGSKNNPLADSTHPPSSRPSPESVAIERFPRFSPKLPQESTAEAMLYIQMDLHPMTLNDYIWGEKETTSRYEKLNQTLIMFITVQINLSLRVGLGIVFISQFASRSF